MKHEQLLIKAMLDLENLTQEHVKKIHGEMNNSLTQLMVWVEDTRTKDVRSILFNWTFG